MQTLAVTNGSQTVCVCVNIYHDDDGSRLCVWRW